MNTSRIVEEVNNTVFSDRIFTKDEITEKIEAMNPKQILETIKKKSFFEQNL